MITREVVDQIIDRLNCSQKSLASFIGVTQTALSMNIEKQFSEIRENKTGKRLLSLLYVVETLSRDQSLTPEVITRIITSPSYPMKDGTYLDVISAIHMGEIQDEFLIEIANKALNDLRSRGHREKKSSKDSFYNRALVG